MFFKEYAGCDSTYMYKQNKSSEKLLYINYTSSLPRDWLMFSLQIGSINSEYISKTTFVRQSFIFFRNATTLAQETAPKLLKKQWWHSCRYSVFQLFLFIHEVLVVDQLLMEIPVSLEEVTHGTYEVYPFTLSNTEVFHKLMRKYCIVRYNQACDLILLTWLFLL